MNPTKVVVFPYKMGSESAKLLAKEMGVRRVYADRNFIPKLGNVVINWGAGYKPIWFHHKFIWINHPNRICTAVNKVDTFYALKEAGVSTPVWTQYKEWAAKWIRNGEMALARMNLEGFDGDGIKICRKLEDLPDNCQLFTKYIPISNEFRVYVVGDKVIDVVEKRRADVEKADPLIRTERNHWIHCQNPKWWPKDAEIESVKAIKALGLDFGGVDIIYNKEKNKSYVLEVNTAPSIYGNITGKFKAALLELIEGL